MCAVPLNQEVLTFFRFKLEVVLRKGPIFSPHWGGGNVASVLLLRIRLLKIINCLLTALNECMCIVGL